MYVVSRDETSSKLRLGLMLYVVSKPETPAKLHLS
jgi:hypothetical protein